MSFLTENLLNDFGHIDRPERVWDSGSDHSSELAEVNDMLTDLTGLLGSGDYRAGTPQRLALNQRISGPAARQSELSAATVKPAGWTWQPTNEKFSEWWERQDTEARNVWLRSIGIRVTFDNPNGVVTWGVEFGYMERIEDHLRFGESTTEAASLLTRASRA